MTGADSDADGRMADLDLLPGVEVVDLLLDAELRVVPAVRAARRAIADAAELIARQLRAGGRLVFVGAGTSGRIAVAEAAELPGTFGLDRRVVLARVAGGSGSTDHDEDDLNLARGDLAELALQSTDVLVAVAASGATPYTVQLTAAARDAGSRVIAVVNAHGTPLAELAHVVIEIEVGPEVLRGSTRLAAGTAQKVALNALSTTAMARLGRVHGQLMIDVEPANAKLRDRSAGIVAEITGRELATARAALSACDHDARAAVLHLVRGLDVHTARVHAARFDTLRDALAAEPAVDRVSEP